MSRDVGREVEQQPAHAAVRPARERLRLERDWFTLLVCEGDALGIVQHPRRQRHARGDRFPAASDTGRLGAEDAQGPVDRACWACAGIRRLVAATCATYAHRISSHTAHAHWINTPR
jgi:hypothetical protein